jgi:concentrative nucleoside transporter, CNT family
MSVHNLVSFAGFFVLIGIAWLFSENRRIVNVRVIFWGSAIQFLFGLLIFVFPPGVSFFLIINDLVVKVMNSATAGAQFVFGRLAISPGTTSASGEESLGFFLAFQGLPTIIFFSALISILYYYGIMQRLIGAFAYVFTRLMRISGAESLCAASNIFVGVESSLTIRPNLPTMTRSELTTVLTAGMATVASNVLAVYVFSLRAEFPTIAGHLISASVLSAPAAIVMSKIIVPETGTPETLGLHVHPSYTRESNLIEAVIGAANAGVKLIVGIVALLIAVLGLVALADLFLTGIGGHVNALTGAAIDWSLKGLMGYVMYPFTLLLGVPLSDAGVVSRLIGERTIVTELAAYQDLAVVMKNHLLSDPRSAVICVYALCGFAHVASLAIFIGGITAIAPSTTSTLSRIGVRALIAATLACLLTACVAGTFFTESSILFGG